MSQRYRVEKAIDQAIGRRILSTCWLFAGLGMLYPSDAAARPGLVAESAGVRACVSGKRLGARRCIGYAPTGRCSSPGEVVWCSVPCSGWEAPNSSPGR